MKAKARLSHVGLALGLAGLLGLSGPRARADQVTLNFSGTITQLNDTTNMFGGKVGVGDAFTGTLVYDTGATDTLTNDPTVGQYVYGSKTSPAYASPEGLTIHIGGASGVTIQPDYNTAFLIDAYDDASSTLGTADGIAASGPTSLDGSSVVPNSITFFELLNLSQTLYSSDAEPTSLSLGDFNVGDIGVSNSNNELALRGAIDGLTTVPEPASILLASLGAVGILGYARRRPN